MNDSVDLEIPRTKAKTLADRSFRVAGPTLWNSIPDEMKKIDNLTTFKTNLKTYLYCQF